MTNARSRIIFAIGHIPDPRLRKAVNPVTFATEGRAWCEGIVQRLPEYFDASQPAETLTAGLNALNQTLGRRSNSSHSDGSHGPIFDLLFRGRDDARPAERFVRFTVFFRPANR